MSKSKQIDEAQKTTTSAECSQARRKDTSPESAPPGVLTSKDVIEDQRAKPQELVEDFRSRIEGAWHRTIQSIVEVGKLVKRAKEELGASYKQLQHKLPFSASMATNFIKIAEHPVLSDPEYWNKLPSAVTTLYYLSRIDEAQLVASIGSGQITPKLTLAQARALVQAPANAATNEEGVTDEIDHKQFVLSIPEPTDSKDLKKFLEEADELAARYHGTLDSPINKRSISEWRRRLTLSNVREEIAATEGKLQNVSLDQLRKLEAATTFLAKAKGVSDPRLPEDYPDYVELSELLGQTDITNTFIKEWCKEKTVPTQLDIAHVEHEVYVWEQLRLAAERQDERGARKRLVKILVENSNRTISGLAKDALDEISRFGDELIDLSSRA